MKVFREEPPLVFRPITLVLETPEELGGVHAAIGNWKDKSLYGDYRVILQALYKKLEEVV